MTIPLPFGEQVRWLSLPDNVEADIASADLPDGFYAGTPGTGNRHLVVGPFTSVLDAAEYLRDSDTYHGEYIVALNAADPLAAIKDTRPVAAMDVAPPEPRDILELEQPLDGHRFYGPIEMDQPGTTHFLGTLNQPWTVRSVAPLPSYIVHPATGHGHLKSEPCTVECSP